MNPLEKLHGPFEVFYGDAMEGPLEAEFQRFLDANYVYPRMGAKAEFLIVDPEHLFNYARDTGESGQAFVVTARFSPERPARNDEYVFRIKEKG